MPLRRTEPAHLAALRDNDDNWTSGIYNCAEDPRIVVRGRFGIKYTVNFAHRLQAWTVLLGSIAAVLLPVGMATIFRSPVWMIYLLAGVTMTGVYALHWWLASRDS